MVSNQNMQKILYILIGPKGVGKTYIGKKVNQNIDIKFLRVEPIWLALAPGEDGWQRVEQEIDRVFQQHHKVMIESLGAGEGFDRMHSALRVKYAIKLVKVFANLDECLRRVKHRNNADHIPVSDDKVEEYNRIAASVSHQWDAIIDNNALASDAKILQIIQSI